MRDASVPRVVFVSSVGAERRHGVGHIADILTGVLGHPFRVEAVTDDDVRAALRGAGMPPGAVEGIVGMAAGSRGLVPEQARDATTTTPTTLASWAYTELRPLLG